MPKKPKPKATLTPRQRQTLTNLLEGRVSSAGLRGQSEFGGHERTKWSLRQQGLINYDDELTEKGRALICSEKANAEKP